MATKINFEDNGQDFLWWTINERGLVVDCGPFQASVWCGSIVVDTELLQPGDPVDFVSRHGDVLMLKHRVKSIEEVA